MEWLTAPPQPKRFRPTQRPKLLTIIREPQAKILHWPTGSSHPELCLGDDCDRCQAGEDNYLRLMIDCVDARGKEGYIFLYAAQADILVEHADNIIGLMFKVSRDRQEYSPLQFEVVGHSRGPLQLIYGGGKGDGDTRAPLQMVEN